MNSGSSGLPFAAGLLAGTAAGAVWMLARNYGRGQADRLFDWNQVAAIALRTGAQGPSLDSGSRQQIENEYESILRSIAGPLADYTGTGLDLAHTQVRALDRGEWVRANVANFQHLLAPLEQSWRETAGGGSSNYPGIAALGRVTLSSELGVLLGYLAKRVLGQYDITLLSPETVEPGKLFFVEPNVQGIQLRLGLPKQEFRLWLTLHEATHAHEFEGHPWVRTYMESLLQEYLKLMIDQITEGDLSLVTGATGLANRLASGQTLMEAAMTAPQHELFLKLQALMTILEGYATHIMSEVGKNLLPHYQEIEARVESRQHQKGQIELLFLKLTGLQLKFDQYRLGTAFVSAVERERGHEFLHRVWDGPDELPTMEEISKPELWFARIDALVA